MYGARKALVMTAAEFKGVAIRGARLAVFLERRKFVILPNHWKDSWSPSEYVIGKGVGL
jgi:hypothetical protein